MCNEMENHFKIAWFENQSDQKPMITIFSTILKRLCLPKTLMIYNRWSYGTKWFFLYHCNWFLSAILLNECLTSSFSLLSSSLWSLNQRHLILKSISQICLCFSTMYYVNWVVFTWTTSIATSTWHYSFNYFYLRSLLFRTNSIFFLNFFVLALFSVTCYLQEVELYQRR